MSDMATPYLNHMEANPYSLLVRITDFLIARQTYLGSVLRITPSHHIVMENILFGKQQDRLGDKWETYDLKPVSYFFPERDIAGGHLVTDSIKERLLDTFEDKIRMHDYQKKHLLDQLAKDCKLLEECNTVDYSLFLVRFPFKLDDDDGQRYIPDLSETTSPWRSGTPSSDNKWIYRAIVLDFFWAKHKIHAMAMTGLISGYNLISGKGHMSITTTPADYRERFLKMVDALFEVTV
jgi:Phosphatidylinositol-4-phosphate 5-Kinase